MAMGGAAAYSLLILYCFYQGLFRGALSDISIILSCRLDRIYSHFCFNPHRDKRAIQR